MNQAELRRMLRSQRAAIDTPPHVRAAALVEQVLADVVIAGLPRGSWVACYASYRNEPPTQRLLQALNDAGFEVCVPAVHGHTLHWHDVTGEIDDPGAWGVDERGIPRPLTPAVATGAAELMALGVRAIVTPALGLERTGARVGQGGGFYDRLFGHLPRHIDGGPYRLGVTHVGGILPDGTIELQPHDEPVDAAIEA